MQACRTGVKSYAVNSSIHAGTKALFLKMGKATYCISALGGQIMHGITLSKFALIRRQSIAFE
jgi:hypothetical protein